MAGRRHGSTSEETAAEGFARPVVLSAKIVAELRDLHEQNRTLSRDEGGPRGRAGRRERREARHAEDDLLRVLGFASYADFERALDGAPDSAAASDAAADAAASDIDPAPPEAVPAPVGGDGETDRAREALRTEAALRRVLQSDNLPGPRGSGNGGSNSDGADPLDELCSRLAAAEEELAEARFEIGRLRDAVTGAGDLSLPHPQPAPAGEPLREVVAELRALFDLLRAERAELAALAAQMRAEADRILSDARVRADDVRDEARADARHIRDDAAAAARELLAQAQAEAVALTRNAMVTVDGLRRLAAEPPADSPPTPPAAGSGG